MMGLSVITERTANAMSWDTWISVCQKMKLDSYLRV